MSALPELVFDPLVPLWAIALLGAAFLAALALLARRAPRSLLPRIGTALLVLLVLANPVRREEIREVRDDVAIALVDMSRSMTIGERRAQADRALEALRETAPDLDWQVATVDQEPGEPTRLGAALEEALGNAPRGRLAGVAVVSDGISADAPDLRDLPEGVPVHLLIAGDPDLDDRRLIVERVPAYSVAGQTAEVRVRVEDDRASGETVELVSETVEGDTRRREVPVGESVTLRIPVERRGRLDVALSVAGRPSEATLINNRALIRLNGVTDRLRVLLVSGIPYPGGRVWRDVLKSDPNVDLVHFTILRLPTSFDPTPPDELSLIPFPVEELFEEHLDDFNLIIFDRFGLTELLSPVYFSQLADRVRSGGGLLVVAGEEFDDPGSLARTQLGDVLPGRPLGPVVEGAFRPELTDTGRRHPVTAVLPEIWGGSDWGEWGALADVEATGGEVLMSGLGGRPLLMLERVGDGRVGLLTSTNVWWWARDVEGPGPRDELLRRIAHWLMQEPDLDEEQLAVRTDGREIGIEARGLNPPGTALAMGPNGGAEPVTLTEAGDGVTRGTVIAEEDGLYRIEAGGRRRFALVGEIAEFAEVRPREAPLSQAAEASGGGLFWLQDGMPETRRVDAGEAGSGGGWIGFVRNESGALVAVRTASLIPPLAALILITAMLALAWWRERR